MRTYHRLKSEKPSLYKYEPWKITEEEFEIENNHHNETIFTLGNGYMGLRGTLEEDYTGPRDTTTPGFYINGVYENEDIIYGEFAPKQPQQYQTMINLMDWTTINLYIDGKKLDIINEDIREYKRVLEIKKGFLKRTFIWELADGKEIKIAIERIVSFKYKHIGLIKYEITPLNFTGSIRVESSLNGNVKNSHHLRNKNPLSIDENGIDDGISYLLVSTKNSDISIGSAVHNRLINVNKGQFFKKNRVDNKRSDEIFEIKIKENTTYKLEKFAAFFTTKDELKKDEILKNCFREVQKAKKIGFNKIKENQKEYLKDYWHFSDVKIEGDDGLQQAFRYNALQILQSTGKDGKSNIAAKGLTGEYYEGHYFWDTETYIIPFYIYSHPEIAKQLLNYRYKILDSARENARRMKLDGALFPWRTINGKEASGNFLGSTVQYHINADIAYAIKNYVQGTDDQEFLFNKGAEILFETARMWLDLGHFEELKGDKFCINEACGPDEYKPAVSNNCYTNHMAKLNLEYAVNTYNSFKEKNQEKLEVLSEKIQLSKKEVKDWEEAAKNMFLPYNEDLGINPQDDSFLYKEEIDIDSIPIDEFPLVKNWHPLTIWKYQIIKQADVILLMFFMGDEFSLEQKKRNYDYYEPKTTHDSSLSPSIYSIIASEIGYHYQAYNYFLQTARLDLDDYNENAYQGLHTACMGSNWMVLVQGFGGMRTYNNMLSFDPYLPKKWKGYEFKIKYRGKLLKVHVRKNYAEYELLEGNQLIFKHGSQKIKLDKNNDYIKLKQE